MNFAALIEEMRAVKAYIEKLTPAERDELMAATNRLQRWLTMTQSAGPLHRRPHEIVRALGVRRPYEIVYPFASERIPR